MQQREDEVSNVQMLSFRLLPVSEVCVCGGERLFAMTVSAF